MAVSVGEQVVSQSNTCVANILPRPTAAANKNKEAQYIIYSNLCRMQGANNRLIKGTVTGNQTPVCLSSALGVLLLLLLVCKLC